MIAKIIMITIGIPGVITLSCALSLYEKEKPNNVHYPKLLFLYVPCFGSVLLGVGAWFNFKSFLDSNYGNKGDLVFSIVLFIGSVLCLVLILFYKGSMIRYEDERFLYRKKWYTYDEVSTLGNDKDNYVFVLKNGKKIRFPILAVGANGLCKAYQDYKKQK